MATTDDILKSEIKSWLEVILKDEKLQEFSVDIVGSEKGEGDMGEIIFVCVNGVVNDEPKKYDLALKCSTRNEAIRKAQPVRDAFLNEIAMYEQIFAHYDKYQTEKTIEYPFKAPPVYFGSYVTENMEVIALQNMNVYGYKRYPNKQPLKKRFVESVLMKYGKIHGTSFSVQHQEPEIFQTLLGSLKDTSDRLIENIDLQEVFGNPIDEAYELLKGELDETVLQKWKELKGQIDFVIREMDKTVTGMKVIIHGDCWSNNFLFLDAERKQLKIALIDYQRARYTSPMIDLSYFIFSSTLGEDLEDLDNMLFSNYYMAFVCQMLGLGIEKPGQIYHLEDFFAEWKRYSKYGIIMACWLLKVASTRPDEETESGEDTGHTSSEQTTDKDNFKNRIRPIIEFAVKKELI